MQIELHYTGHALVDVGLAVLCAMNVKRCPDELTDDDLFHAAETLKDYYCHHKAVQNYISVIFTNSHFVQPAKKVEEKEAYADQYLFAFRHDYPAAEGELRCVYFPQLAAVHTAFRQHIPLLNGEQIPNFSPMGQAGLPVSGLALLAIHAMPLGCIKCERPQPNSPSRKETRLLAFHQLSNPFDASHGAMTLVLARRAYRDINRHLSQISADDAAKIPGLGGTPHTRYVERLIDAKREAQEQGANIDNITGYYFTNYGPGASIQVLRLDHLVTRFVDVAVQDASAAWQRAVESSWQREKGEITVADEVKQSRRNFLYEGLFELPDNALRFLGHLARGRSWDLIEIFLREVMQMEQERIDTYRQLGEILARYALEFENQPQSFYYSFSRARSYVMLRGVIRTAAEKLWKQHPGEVLFTYDQFIAAFEHPSEVYSQWKLARDLISIKLLEQLQRAQVDLSELPEDEAVETEEQEQ